MSFLFLAFSSPGPWHPGASKVAWKPNAQPRGCAKEQIPRLRIGLQCSKSRQPGKRDLRVRPRQARTDSEVHPTESQTHDIKTAWAERDSSRPEYLPPPPTRMKSWKPIPPVAYAWTPASGSRTQRYPVAATVQVSVPEPRSAAGGSRQQHRLPVDAGREGGVAVAAAGRAPAGDPVDARSKGSMASGAGVALHHLPAVDRPGRDLGYRYPPSGRRHRGLRSPLHLPAAEMAGVP